MKLSEQDLDKIASVTLQHYDQNAEDFWQGTRGSRTFDDRYF